MWQELHASMESQGATIVTVALDLRGADAARPFVDAAALTCPALVDQAHVTDELLGFVNVPMAVWIDEEGVLVQPAHVAQVQRSALADSPIPEGLPDNFRRMLEAVRRIPRTANEYVPALQDWVANGASSRFALTPEQVVERSRPRPAEHAEAAACFELAQWLWRGGRGDDAVVWFRRAHALHPENWTYKRQAWTLATTGEGAPSDLVQGPTDLYEGNWLDDITAAGPEAYYEPLRLER